MLELCSRAITYIFEELLKKATKGHTFHIMATDGIHGS